MLFANKAVNLALDFVLPYECIGCGLSQSWLCQNCMSDIICDTEQNCVLCRRPSAGGETHKQCLSETNIDGVIIATRKNKLLQKAIHIFKYHNTRSLAGILANIITRNIESSPLSCSVLLNSNASLIPIPLHPHKKWDRGYNHTELMANELSKTWPMRVQNDILVRVKNTKPQAQLSKSMRLKNTINAFSVPENTDIPKSVILLDDVMTTGATMNDAARALKRAGVQNIWGIVLMRE